jgi:hypothetical protein
MRGVGIQTTHGGDELGETTETDSREVARLQATDGRLSEAAAAAQVALGPPYDSSTALHHPPDDLPASLDIGVPIAAYFRAPSHVI